MPKNHARKNDLAAIKDELGVKHACAIALLDHPDAYERETLERYLAEYIDINTYGEALAYLRQEQADPRNQIMCDKCDWTYGMICPECPGCGCYNGQCSGWRHTEFQAEMDAATGESSDYDPNACQECGAGGGGDPYGECCCYEDDDEVEAA
ncbi:hypothetical protein ACUN3E_38320 [Streptomyces sp. Ju416(a)]|uniref:hypothetical protein n=1 Tax=Streptomyces sp. Ju416(a) TaxID=3446591 RepID=UPI00403DA2C5